MSASRDVLIVGGGIAGLSTALAAAEPILLAPWAARELASLIAGEAADRGLGLFSCQRFDKTSLTD